jgi:hypothetical protein
LNGTECDGEFCNVCQLIGGGSAACNTNILPVDRLTCYECNGDANSTCANLNGTDISTIICPIFRNDDRCFSTRAGGNVTRGCQSSIPAGRCDHNVCGFCTGHGCNSLNFPQLNAAFGMHAAGKSLLLAAIAVALLRFFNNRII